MASAWHVQNEESHIEKAIQSVNVPGTDTQPQIIVVDAGSNDKTCSIARSHPGVKVLQVPGGRGAQLNEGGHQPLHACHSRTDAAGLLDVVCKSM